MSDMTYHLAIDKELATKTQELLAELGMDMNAVFRALLNKFVNKEVFIHPEIHKEIDYNFNSRRVSVKGKYKGQIWSDAFDEPLDCMKDYMLTDSEMQVLHQTEMGKTPKPSAK